MSADEVDAIQVVVSSRNAIADNVVQIELERADGGVLPEWTPGAHIDVHLPAMVRQYSLCGRPESRDRYVIAILKQQDGRGGSDYMHDRLEVGTTLTISTPRNHFELVDAAGYCFVAGGIGITPILSMIRSVVSRGRHDCNQPCTRIGLGGLCPHCAEPVALTDLIDTIQTATNC